MQRRAAEESLTDHGKDNSNGRAHVGDAIRHKPGILGFLRQIGFMGATGRSTATVSQSSQALSVLYIVSNFNLDSNANTKYGRRSRNRRSSSPLDM